MPDDGADLREVVLACFRAGLAAVEPRRVVSEALAPEVLSSEALSSGALSSETLSGRPVESSGRVVVAAIGKAAVPMTRGALDVLGDRIDEGVVIAPAEIGDLPLSIHCFQGGHPLPNEAGVEGARELLALANGLNADDLMLALISGGGSALMTLPPEGISLTDVRRATDTMLRAGATIVELNGLRKHIDRMKGGRLARIAMPAAVWGLVLSDVVGDPLDAIASGPLVPDPTTFREVLEPLDRLGVRDALPPVVVAHLEAGSRGEIEESPKADDPSFDRVEVAIVGNNRMAAEAACAEAARRGFATKLLSTTQTGEAREVGHRLGGLAREIREGRAAPRPPACLVAAGETTVTVRGSGRGGRNQELALGAALALAGVPGALVASLGTDGIDGPTDAAGALATGETVARARTLGLDPEDHLARNDSYPFFAALDDLVITGPTGTNVMDLQFVFVR